MLNVSDETKLAYQNDGSIKNYKIIFPEIKDENGNELTFENPKIVAESISIDEGIQSGDNLDYTGCLSSTAEFEIANNAYDLKDKIVKISVQVEGTEEIPLFYGKVDKVTKESAYAMTKKINAYDPMREFSDKDATEWYNSLTYPMTYKEFRDSFWKKFGLVENANDNQQEITLINDTVTIKERQLTENSSITTDSVIKAICQVNACYGMFDREGKFKYVYLEPITKALYPSANLFPDTALFPSKNNDIREIYVTSRIIDIKYEDNDTDPIVGVVMYDSTANYYTGDEQETDDKGIIGRAGKTGKDDLKFEIDNNFLVYGLGGTDANNMCQRILNTISKVTFRDIELKVKGLPYVECGDVLVIEGAKDVIHSYVLTRSLTGTSDLQDSISADGEKIDTSIVSVSEILEAELFRRKIGDDHMYSLIEQTRDSITLEIRDVDENLRTAIDLTNGQIVAEVERAQNEEDAITSRVIINETELSAHAEKIETLSDELIIQSNTIKIKANTVDIDADCFKINGKSICPIRQDLDTLKLKAITVDNLQAKIANLTVVNAKHIVTGYIDCVAGRYGADYFDGTMKCNRLEANGTVQIKSKTVSWKTIKVATPDGGMADINYLSY